LQQAQHLVAAGAEILDIGAESTSPVSAKLDPQLEGQRLLPVLNAIMAAKHAFMLPPLISVDTRHAEVAALALALHVDWINDVTGFSDPAMRAVLKDAKADCLVMHHITIPPSQKQIIPRGHDPVDYILQWGQQKLAELESAGIRRERIIIDPGIGFGNSPGQILAMLKDAHKFSELGVRILIGHSRKSFMNVLTPHNAAERDIETLAITLKLAEAPVDYLRVHNIEMSARALRVNAVLGS
jgi:dihydropteroate synthase